MTVLTPAPPALVLPADKPVKPTPEPCPVCREVVLFPFVRDDDTYGRRIWMHCECGTLFQVAGQKPIPPEDRSETYTKHWIRDTQWFNDRSNWLKRVYLPLVEDMIQGRKVLEARYIHHISLDHFRERGWVTYGLDECKAAVPGDHPHAEQTIMDWKPKVPFLKFDLVWMADTIQSYEHPFPVLAKAYSLLEHHGLMFVSAPETDFLHRVGPRDFGHFHPAANRIMLRGETFAKMAERVGFHTMLLRKSASRAGMVWDQFHWIGIRK